MAKDKTETQEKIIEKGYAVNPEVAKQGYAGNFKKLGGGLIVVSKPHYENDVDPKTGQVGPVLRKASKVFIDEVEQKDYEIPADYPIPILYSLAFAHIILPTPEQAEKLNKWAKDKANGKV